MISTSKTTIKHFSHSNKATDALRQARLKQSDSEANDVFGELQKPGKTHFGMNWSALSALEPYLPIIQKLVCDKIVIFKVSTSLSPPVWLLPTYFHLEPEYSGALPSIHK
jgi:hypothetical protein